MKKWRDAVGFEGLYSVSECGDVLRVSTGRTLTPYLSKRGYLMVAMRTKESVLQKQVSVHRIVAMAFVEGHAPGLQVNHIDGVKTNNAIGNLEWVTGADNIKHAIETGLCERPTIIVAAPLKGSVGFCFSSINQAVAHGFNSGNIYRCLAGGTSQHGGYRWLRAWPPDAEPGNPATPASAALTPRSNPYPIKQAAGEGRRRGFAMSEMNYDPNLTCSGRMAKQTVRLTFGLWDYRATMEIEVGGNCRGFTVIDYAVRSAYEKLERRGMYGSKQTYAVINMPKIGDPDDVMECDEGSDGWDRLRGEDWLKDMLIAAEIVAIRPK